MAIKHMTGDTEWRSGVVAGLGEQYRVLKYSGSLGGGVLRVYSETMDGADGEALEVPLADAKLSASSVDDNGDAVQQMVFQTTGMIVVKLTGSTSPDVWVSVE